MPDGGRNVGPFSFRLQKGGSGQSLVFSAFGLKTGESVEDETESDEIAEWNALAKYSIEGVWK